ncbi:hydroxymethylbilane synthase [Nannocystis bainbridge]|uniref:Porphobilinogen deaminase n=1 Tax=Nannocystis bainbridge TaxID=2995303 RepID=A0ABT5EAM0_9BACT|nr:hydroxymethylbilane synthase [Nannocystis bainbridge]MDC0722907.1 hydroxymethylbilane synthase [Nannocystis bainbridge]
MTASTKPDLDRPLRIGTRASELALWQAHHIRDRLRAVWGDGLAVELVHITTEGDRIQDRPLNQIGGKGLFVNAIEERLAAGEVDLAVHSMKDLPGRLHPGLAIVCTPPREDARDALVLGPALRAALCPEGQAPSDLSIQSLPAGAALGTTSLRRGALALRLHPGLQIRPLRGNVPTRLRKLDAGDYDAILLATAGLVRLGLSERIDARLDPEQFCPAACQGILALESRADDDRVRALVAPLNDAHAATVAAAERSFLARLDGGCQVPMGCHAELQGELLHVRGVITDPSGRPCFTAARVGPPADAADLGTAVAELLLRLGADAVLAALAHKT